jgi:hypothetical protein
MSRPGGGGAGRSMKHLLPSPTFCSHQQDRFMVIRHTFFGCFGQCENCLLHVKTGGYYLLQTSVINRFQFFVVRDENGVAEFTGLQSDALCTVRTKLLIVKFMCIAVRAVQKWHWRVVAFVTAVPAVKESYCLLSSLWKQKVPRALDFLSTVDSVTACATEGWRSYGSKRVVALFK